MFLGNWARAHRTAAKRTLVTAVAATALLGPAIPAGALARANAYSSAPSPSLTFTQVGSNAEATAKWTYPFSAPAAQEATRLDLYPAGSQTAVTTVGCARGCTSYSFFNLVPGAAYTVVLTFNDNGTWQSQKPSATLTLRSTCASGVCVSVNARQPLRPVDHAGQGLLHGVFAGADQQFLPALNVSMHRGIVPQGQNGLDWEEWAANSPSWPTTLVISDAWSIVNGGNPPAPTADELPAYEQWLSGYISQVLASGERVDYFEPYNEPDLNYYSATVAPTVTADEMYQLFLASYQVIKSLDPSAQIIGPSMGEFEEWPINFEAGMNLVDFLNFAAANGIQLAALTWHEISTYQPRRILNDVTEARRLLQQYPQVGNPKIFINEVGDESTQRSPGWDVNYLAAITDSGVDLAGRTCFENDCFQPDLDGLLTSDGTQTLPDYWVRAFYGGMAGQMVTASSSDDSLRSVASYDGSKTVDVLLGRGIGCTDSTRCGGMGAPAGPVRETTTVTVPWGSGTVGIVGRDISGASISPYGQPAPSVSSTLRVPPNGVITLSVPSFADGDAWTYTITHS